MLTCFGRNISPSSGGCVDLTRFFGYGGSLAPSSGGGTADAAGGWGDPTHLRIGVYAMRDGSRVSENMSFEQCKIYVYLHLQISHIQLAKIQGSGFIPKFENCELTR